MKSVTKLCGMRLSKSILSRVVLFAFALFMSTFFFSSACFATTTRDYRIDFSYWNSGLEYAVRNALSQIDGKDRRIGYVYLSDLEKIKELSIDYSEVSNIRGIEKLKNLQTLKIYTNSNRDVKLFYDRICKYALQKLYRRGTYLGNLKHLTKIDVSGNGIDNVSYVAAALLSLNQIKSIDLSNNNIKDISALGYYHSLKELNLSNNKINNISTLRYLRGLEKLDISNNLVQNIYSLRYLRNLKSLNISGNNIENLYPLSNLINLEELYMSGNIQAKDITSDRYIEISLDNVIDDKKLKLNGRYISIHSKDWNDNYTLYNNKYIIYHNDYVIYNKKPVDITPLEKITSLKKLDVSNNYLTSIYPLHTLTNLEYLDISHNDINDISYIADMAKLKELHAGFNGQIEDIGVLRGLISLEKLDISNNNVSDISSLGNLVRLKYLDISCNNVSNIDSLEWVSPHEDIDTGEYLKGLVELRLNGNTIRDVYALACMSNLEKLYIDSTGIDLSPIKNLKKLKKIRE
ncbi:internalin-A precursor [Clostridium tepidiprofundi DSM 19306]|uniref:Internalin-A n=1 Tax=Clostridium tepidiprofundi DSM 19306 TaxID=1121338 RepID=A0A151B3F9_9CLOT|nr:leucine-rich repeat domain-containing protein [Clostridium tepidiprofundi]KYH34458.1 internalin-A precursor [Clostridium tepidiprofundi DSM 19306]